MTFFRELAEKPWLAENGPLALSVAQKETNQFPAKTALKFFLGVVTVLFFLFTITFLSRSQSNDFQALSGEPWLPFTDAYQLWINTGILLLAGICLQFAVFSLKKQQMNLFILLISCGCLFSCLFIFGQINVWQNLYQAGFALAENPANSYFYLLTGIHGLHLIGGVLALSYVVWQFWLKNNNKKLVDNLTLCTVYWHYLFVVWLFLVALLTGNTATYKTIAAFCGF